MRAFISSVYLFLYAPILYVIYASFSRDIVWPFPPSFTTDAYVELFDNALYTDALHNSLMLGLGSGVLSTLLATAGVIGILRYPSRRRVPVCTQRSSTCAVPRSMYRSRKHWRRWR